MKFFAMTIVTTSLITTATTASANIHRRPADAVNPSRQPQGRRSQRTGRSRSAAAGNARKTWVMDALGATVADSANYEYAL